MDDNNAQISLEYMLIFAISLIILMVFTLPLAEESIKNTLDVSDSLDMKYDMSKIAQAIKEVYGEGQGSKRTIKMDCDKNVKVTIFKNYLSCNLKLKSNSNKQIKQYYKSTLEKTSLNLRNGENVIVVEWPAGGGNMIIYTE